MMRHLHLASTTRSKKSSHDTQQRYPMNHNDPFIVLHLRVKLMQSIFF